MKYKLKKKTKAVLSIDIGVYHLGLSVALVNDAFAIQEIVWLDLIDITVFKCDKTCKLHHTKTVSDWLEHVFQDNLEFFEKSDIILIEKQPPLGLIAVEQLIFYRWRDKAVLVSPNSVHKYFSIQDSDYEQRKVHSETIAKRYIPQSLAEQLTFYERQHDITDSILFIIYWCGKKEKEEEYKHKVERRKQAYQDFLENKGWTEENMYNYFKYVPEN